MKLLIILILSMPVLSGPKRPPAPSLQNMFEAITAFQRLLISRNAPHSVPEQAQVRYENQQFNIIPNTGAGNECFFLALQQAGIALTRELTVEILTELLQNPQTRLVIARDLAQDWRDGRFAPRTFVLAADLLAAGNLEDLVEQVGTNDVLLREYIEDVIGGPNMFAFTAQQHGLIDLLAEAMQAQIRVLARNPTNQANLTLLHETQRHRDTNPGTIHLLLTGGHFELMQDPRNQVFEPMPIQAHGPIITCDLDNNEKFYLLRLGSTNPSEILGFLSGVLENRRSVSALRTVIVPSTSSQIRSGADFFRIFQDMLELISLPHLQPGFTTLLQQSLGIKNPAKSPDIKSLILQASRNAQSKESLGRYTIPPGLTESEAQLLARIMSSLFVIYPYIDTYFRQYSSLNSHHVEDRQDLLEPMKLQVIQDIFSELRAIVLTPVQAFGKAYKRFSSGSMSYTEFLSAMTSIRKDENNLFIFDILAFLDARPRGPMNPRELNELIKLLRLLKRTTSFPEKYIDILGAYDSDWSRAIKAARSHSQASCEAPTTAPGCSEASELTPQKPEKVKTRGEPLPGFTGSVQRFAQEVREQIQKASAYPLNRLATQALMAIIHLQPIEEATARALLEQVGLSITTGRAAGSMRGVSYSDSEKRAGGFEIGHGGYLDGMVKNPAQLLKALCVAAQYDQRLAALLEQYEINWKSYFNSRSEQ
ncbi:MAG: hypothetical protein WCK49_06680 [Myxococcaceae bacterium]